MTLCVTQAQHTHSNQSWWAQFAFYTESPSRLRCRDLLKFTTYLATAALLDKKPAEELSLSWSPWMGHGQGQAGVTSKLFLPR